MGEETITVGETRGRETGGSDVELPIVDLLTGRGFVTGKSGSGKSNSASVVAEKLLDRGYSLLAVDIDGEYYGLKEEYEILHVGGDEECDLQVDEEHAEKIAELALEGSVPIILDVSSFLDESKARDLLMETTKHLFAKGKKCKQPFLMLVEEIHEYIPEGGGIDECGRMLIKISKRGRKHGLGIVGISQRPADVKKDFITQCDWLVWHRLTWNNDTKVVSRILGSEYADEIEDMADGEGFLMTDWNEPIRRVQFERKQTFDAGATPGLDDFERPELKSVSGDLVDELQEITDERERRENRVNELERELQQREERIRDLERQLAEARDLKRMADRFSRAMMEQVTGRPLSAAPGRQSELEEALDGPIRRDPELEAVRNGEREPMSPPVPDADAERDGDDPGTHEEGEDGTDTAEGTDEADRTDEPVDAGDTGNDGAEAIWTATDTDDADASTDTDGTDASTDTDLGREDGANADATATDSEGRDGPFDSGVRNGNGAGNTAQDAPVDSSTDTVAAPGGSGGSVSDRLDENRRESDGEADPDVDPSSGDSLADRLRAEIDALDDVTAGMLRQYRQDGPIEPDDAHAAAGGSGDRRPAYAANRRLRQRGLIAHVGCGQYDYALAELVRAELSDPVRPEATPSDGAVADVVEAVEAGDPRVGGSVPENTQGSGHEGGGESERTADRSRVRR